MIGNKYLVHFETFLFIYIPMVGILFIINHIYNFYQTINITIIYYDYFTMI